MLLFSYLSVQLLVDLWCGQSVCPSVRVESSSCGEKNPHLVFPRNNSGGKEKTVGQQTNQLVTPPVKPHSGCRWLRVSRIFRLRATCLVNDSCATTTPWLLKERRDEAQLVPAFCPNLKSAKTRQINLVEDRPKAYRPFCERRWPWGLLWLD